MWKTLVPPSSARRKKSADGTSAVLYGSARWKRPADETSAVLMAFKIIKRLPAFLTSVHRLAGCRAELGNHPRIRRTAMRTSYLRRFGKQRMFIRFSLLGWSDAVFEQFPAAGFAHPVGCPGRRKNRNNPYPGVAVILQHRFNLDLDGIHGRASRISRGNEDLRYPALPAHFPHDPEVDYTQDGNLWIRDKLQEFPNFLGWICANGHIFQTADRPYSFFEYFFNKIILNFKTAAVPLPR